MENSMTITQNIKNGITIGSTIAIPLLDINT
jgi:hypothetical protein